MEFGYIDIKPLSDDERQNYNEIELLKKAKGGDKKAKELLLRMHYKFIISIISKFEIFKQYSDDVIANAILYYFKAIENVDISRLERGENNFITYLVYYVKQGVFEFMEFIYNGASIRGLSKKNYHEIINLFKQGYTVNEVYEYFKNKNINVHKWQIEKVYFNLQNNFISLDENISDEGFKKCEEFIPDNSFNLEEEVIQDIYNEQLRKKIEDILNSDFLDERERKVLKMRLDIDFYGEKRKLEDIAKVLGISRERVRQIEHKALRKIRSIYGSELRKILNKK